MTEIESFEKSIRALKTELLKTSHSNFEISSEEKEGKEYWAHRCQFQNKDAIFRKAKSTPTKKGQFVTVWKRNQEGITAPFEENDNIENYIILCISEGIHGLFIFPKSILIKNKIMATKNVDGKRGFRVYPPWEKDLKSKQAIKTQQWQVEYFSQLDEFI